MVEFTKVALTLLSGPMLPRKSELVWVKCLFRIVHQRDPAASLVMMNTNLGIFFETDMVVVASCEMRGQLFEVRQTLYVKVNATRPEIVPLV